jgi:hypothetical protein
VLISCFRKSSKSGPLLDVNDLGLFKKYGVLANDSTLILFINGSSNIASLSSENSNTSSSI